MQRLKITILGANWQLFRLERIVKCSYFILSTQNIKFYWFVMKIKKFVLPIWWYNRGCFALGNKYLEGVCLTHVVQSLVFKHNWLYTECLKKVQFWIVSQIKNVKHFHEIFICMIGWRSLLSYVSNFCYMLGWALATCVKQIYEN